MKNCPHCNTLMEDNAFYCPACGQRMSEPAAAPADNDAFYVFRRNLRHERKCWSILGKVYLGLTIFFALYFGVIGMALGVGIGGGEGSVAAGVMFLYSVLIVVLMLPVVIANFVMKRKLDGYIEQIETNPEPAKDRATNPGFIVLAALFNEVALIFVILNFIHVKRNGHRIRQ